MKINIYSQIKNWNDFLLQSAILIPFAFYSFHKYQIIEVLYPFYVFLSIQFGLTLYVHLCYYFQNRGQEYIITYNSITRIKNNRKELFLNSDITKIEICKSANMDKWGIPFTTFESFRCANVYLNNGHKFIITNLIDYNIDKSLQILNGVKFVRRRGFSFFV